MNVTVDRNLAKKNFKSKKRGKIVKVCLQRYCNLTTFLNILNFKGFLRDFSPL